MIWEGFERYIEREGKQKKTTGEWGDDLAGYLTLQLHAQEILWNPKVGWWLANSLRKCNTQIRPGCFMNYSVSTVCTSFGKQKTTTLKQVWMVIGWVLWVKGVETMSYKKQISGLQTQTWPSVIGIGERKKKDLLSQVIYFFHIFVYDRYGKNWHCKIVTVKTHSKDSIHRHLNKLCKLLEANEIREYSSDTLISHNIKSWNE